MTTFELDNETKYKLDTGLVDIWQLARHIFDYETGGRIVTPSSSIESWAAPWFPPQIVDTYKAKALDILQWLSENSEKVTKSCQCGCECVNSNCQCK